MEPARGSITRRHPRGKDVGGRLTLIGILLMVVGAGMVLALRLPDWLADGEEKAKQPLPQTTSITEPAQPAEAPLPPAGDDVGDESAAPPADGMDPEAAKATPPAPAPKLPDRSLSPEKIMPSAEALPWPREADLPILERYDIDWKLGDTVLSDVMDHTYDFESGAKQQGTAALYYLLRVAAKLPREAFAPDPVEQEVGYEDLLKTPSAYRGVPVTVSGIVARVTAFPVPRPEISGIATFWVIDMAPRVKGDVGPVFTVVLSESPVGISRGDWIRVKAYFYKIRDYDSTDYDPEQEITHVYTYQSPMVVGQHVEKTSARRVVSIGGAKQDTLLLLTFVGLVVLGGMILLYVRRLASRRAEYNRRVDKAIELSPDEIGQRVSFLSEIEQSDGLPGQHLPERPLEDD